MPPTVRRQREIERTRVEILNAAARAFLQRGFLATTMQDIASEAGYTAPSLYTYFKSKDEVVNAFREHVHVRVLSGFDAPMPTGMTFRQKLELLIQRLEAQAKDTTDAVRAFFEVFPIGGSLMIFTDRLETWIREQAEVEQHGAYSPNELATFVSGIFFGFYARWARSGDPDFSTIENTLMLDLFFHGVGEETA